MAPPPPEAVARDSAPVRVPLARDFELALEKGTGEWPAAGYRLDAFPGDDWRRDPEVHGDPSEGAEYGYCADGSCIPCSREKLAHRCAAVPSTLRVWTPEAPRLVRPEQVPFLAEAHRERLRWTARKGIPVNALGLALFMVPIVLRPTLGRTVLVLLPAISAIGLLAGVHLLREARKAGPHVFPQARLALRHAAWVKRQPRVATLWLLGCLLAVMGVRMLGGDAAVEAAGLVKPAVWRGEAWRLLTGPLLHADLVHIWMNGGALLGVGPLVEVHARRGVLPLVFLASVLGGSLLSLFLLPDTTSVGASGGIAATAVLGLVAIQVIDNAAHLGGLLAGALLGRFLAEPARSPEPWTGRAGRIALAVTCAGGVLAICLMIFARV